MNKYATANKRDQIKAKTNGYKRQEKALREFKQVLEDIVFMMQSASVVETVYLYWVNRARKQFVMETKSTSLENVMFKDRITFDDHFLERFKDISEPTTAEVGKDIPAAALNHYYNKVPVQYVTLLPFVNNGETVAITVLESGSQLQKSAQSDIIFSYKRALRNVLNTYLEISDLYGQQEEWINYEEDIEELDVRTHRAEIIKKLLNSIQGLLSHGGASFVAQGSDEWCSMMNSDQAHNAPRVGLCMAERSLCYDAAESGQPEFAIHFNDNPKRLSARELNSEGATMAIPLKMDDRRQGVVLAYDKNPLIFKESTKHKIRNLVRVAGLKIQANETSLDIDEPMFINDYGALLPDVWEGVVQAELNRLKKGQQEQPTWFGLITLSNLPEIRTKLRLEELNFMQRSLISTFSPSQYGYPGIMGYHSDYIYSFLIQNADTHAVENWLRALEGKFEEPLDIYGGRNIQTDFRVGYIQLEEKHEDVYELLTEAKSELSKAFNTTQREKI